MHKLRSTVSPVPHCLTEYVIIHDMKMQAAVEFTYTIARFIAAGRNVGGLLALR